jgi:hypothetical protein
MAKAGRPVGTNKLDICKPELIKLLQSGVPVIHACAAIGLSEPTYYDWIARGKEGKTGQYVDFLNDINKAKAQAVSRNVALIQKAASGGTWQAAAWWLERTQPLDFGKHETAKVEHSGGIAINLKMVDCSDKDDET